MGSTGVKVAGGRRRHRRRLRPRRWPVRVGLGGPGRRRPRGRASSRPGSTARRSSTTSRPVVARPARVPPRLGPAPPEPARLGRAPSRTTQGPHDHRHVLSQLRTLEAESIHIFREVAAEMQRPCLLFSGGKDSIVMLHVAPQGVRAGAHPVPGHARRHRPELPERSSPTATAGSRSWASSSSSPPSQDAIERGLVQRGAQRLAQPDPDAGAAGGRREARLRRPVRRRAPRRGEGPRQGARVLVPRRVRPVGPEEPAAGDLEPLQRPRPPGPEHPRVPAVELDRARHLDLHR